MRASFIIEKPTESRKNSFFSTFKESKRVRWVAYRHYTH